MLPAPQHYGLDGGCQAEGQHADDQRHSVRADQVEEENPDGANNRHQNGHVAHFLVAM